MSAGYEWGKLPFSSLNQSTVTFSWDRKRTSEKLLIERSGDDDDYYEEGNFGSTIVVKDGSGFKNSIGDYVGDLCLHNACNRFSKRARDITTRSKWKWAH